MTNRLQITADSTGRTRLIDQAGHDISGAVTGCEISMKPGAIPIALLSVVVASDMNIEAEGLLSISSLRAMAEHYGYKLIKADE